MSHSGDGTNYSKKHREMLQKERQRNDRRAADFMRSFIDEEDPYESIIGSEGDQSPYPPGPEVYSEWNQKDRDPAHEQESYANMAPEIVAYLKKIKALKDKDLNQIYGLMLQQLQLAATSLMMTKSGRNRDLRTTQILMGTYTELRDRIMKGSTAAAKFAKELHGALLETKRGLPLGNEDTLNGILGLIGGLEQMKYAPMGEAHMHRSGKLRAAADKYANDSSSDNYRGSPNKKQRRG